MKLISHRGNINGKVVELENKPEYIDKAISLGYFVEIDLWYENSVLSLGHDNPTHEIDYYWLLSRYEKLYIHCKNPEALVYLKQSGVMFNYFYHTEEELVLTSLGEIWVYPGKQKINGSIAVLPELHNDDISECIGICSDYIENYK